MVSWETEKQMGKCLMEIGYGENDRQVKPLTVVSKGGIWH
jgi:hypothetical protein